VYKIGKKEGQQRDAQPQKDQKSRRAHSEAGKTAQAHR
jgi:hypothetical protein